jgi:hypothetical protein
MRFRQAQRQGDAPVLAQETGRTRAEVMENVKKKLGFDPDF